MTLEVKDGILKIKDRYGRVKFSTGDALVFRRVGMLGSGTVGGSTQTTNQSFLLSVNNSTYYNRRDVYLPKIKITATSGNLAQHLLGLWFYPHEPVPIHIEYTAAGYIKNIEVLTVVTYLPGRFSVHLYNHANGFSNNAVAFVSYDYQLELFSYRND